MNAMSGSPRGFVIWVLLSALAHASTILVLAQNQTGFISIDCGATDYTSYADPVTGIIYVPDGNYIDSGNTSGISTQYRYSSLQRQFENVRSFPDGNKNCYTLNPLQVPDTKYLIRAQFMYGNYDAKSNIPKFDLYSGVNYWTTVVIQKAGDIFTAEMVQNRSVSNVIHVCLVNTGLGTPFVSVIELRLLRKDTYVPTSGSLNLEHRHNPGSSVVYRYADDAYDRLWNTIDWSDDMKVLSTYKSVQSRNNCYEPPSAVMSTAVTPIDPTEPLGFNWTAKDERYDYYIYLHFAEIETLATNESRSFDIHWNNQIFHRNFTPSFLSSRTIYTPKPLTPQKMHNFSLEMISGSTHPPLLNAMEIYSVRNTLQPETDPTDAEAVRNIKSAYSLNKIWQGDPCAPRYYSWEGITCTFAECEPPRIIALNLTSSNLNGPITHYISQLKLLEQLDLSNNNLTGTIPDFLSEMTSLKYLNLKGNMLTGVVPSEIVERSSQGLLNLNVEGNSDLCLLSYQCKQSSRPKRTRSSLPISIIGSVVGAVFFVITILTIFFCIVKRKKLQVENKKQSIQIPNRIFTYADVLRMTSNLTTKIGEGGFGAVYLGYLEDSKIPVAVKMLSQSSSQGYKEFKAEAELLMVVHHRNLTSLIGYCDEGDNLGLIYEYMANGNLKSHLSGEKSEYLTWEKRLNIALYSANGLEYLHNGCTPQIVHRDIKTTNILLNDKFEAKLADFGLSRTFTKDAYGPTTTVAGSFGYLDPEYYMTRKLNEKSDVYSFGVVLMEIISGRLIVENEQTERLHITKWVSQVLSEEGDIKVIIDRRLRGDYDTNSAWKVIEVAISCVSATNKRPNMNHVVNELSQCLSMEESRKYKGFIHENIDSVEMASYSLNNEFTDPAAR